MALPRAGRALDVRPAAESGEGHIENAINFGLGGKFATSGVSTPSAPNWAAPSAARAIMEGVEIARQGSGPTYPTYVVVADRGAWTDSTGWVLSKGAMHILTDPQGLAVTIQYDSLVDRHLEETPLELTANPRAPLEMGYQDLGRYISALERSGWTPTASSA